MLCLRTRPRQRTVTCNCRQIKRCGKSTARRPETAATCIIDSNLAPTRVTYRSDPQPFGPRRTGRSSGSGSPPGEYRCRPSATATRRSLRLARLRHVEGLERWGRRSTGRTKDGVAGHRTVRYGESGRGHCWTTTDGDTGCDDDDDRCAT